jgi:hypothetical protein
LKTTKFTFTVSLSEPVGYAIEVEARTFPGTASAKEDYVPIAESKDPWVWPVILKFSRGMTKRYLTVAVRADKKPELDEWFFVKLYCKYEDAEMVDGEGKGTILDDDSPGAQNAATSRDAAANALLGRAAFAACFEQLGRKKNDKDAASADVILTAP